MWGCHESTCRIQIVVGTQKIVDEAYTVENTASGVARKHCISRRLIQAWRTKLAKLNDQGEINPIDCRVKCNNDPSSATRKKWCACAALRWLGWTQQQIYRRKSQHVDAPISCEKPDCRFSQTAWYGNTRRYFWTYLTYYEMARIAQYRIQKGNNHQWNPKGLIWRS